MKQNTLKKIAKRQSESKRQREKLKLSLLRPVDGLQKLVTPERKEILQLDIKTLLPKLKHDKLKPIEVLEAFQV